MVLGTIFRPYFYALCACGHYDRKKSKAKETKALTCLKKNADSMSRRTNFLITTDSAKKPPFEAMNLLESEYLPLLVAEFDFAQSHHSLLPHQGQRVASV